MFDAYCGWCYGFDAAFERFVAEHADQIDLTIFSGGLFTGARVAPMASMPYIGAANDRIAALTGARFGDGYLRTAADPTFAMDSTDAAVGFAAMRRLAPGRELEVAAEMQRSFYQDGRSLSDSATYRVIAARLDLDAEAVVAALDSPRARADAQEDFRRARSLGVDSFPTVLVELSDGSTGRLGGPASTAEQLAVAFATLRLHGTDAD
ncbi:MAG: DsbA family protein [Cellulomonadaceae bacterium]|nr:DsbA family protein [Cellulomonadaceae bacterium]